MSTAPKIVALIPARSGSVRVENKNVRLLGGHPLIAYTIQSALRSEVFSDVVVSTDSDVIADIAKKYGASVPFIRPEEYACSLSPDIDWVVHALNSLSEQGQIFDIFAILRPTSPFRTPQTIQRAIKQFLSHDGRVDSLRAVQLCGEHPMKMWVERDGQLIPLFPFGPESPPWHSSAYQSLPKVYVQNASLEIAWTNVPLEKKSISGTQIIPFFTEGNEGFDINTSMDWKNAESLIRQEGVQAKLDLH